MATDSSDGGGGVVARPTGEGRFQTEITVGANRFVADEPAEVGGDGTGPTPYELLSAALAACTAMTLRLYAERKGWDLPPFVVEVAHSLVPGDPGTAARDRFDRQIAFDGPLDEERRAKLLELADKCPVHRTLSRNSEVLTCFAPAGERPVAEPPFRHEQEMEAACAD